MLDPAINNQRLFSDHYLSSVLPTTAEWTDNRHDPGAAITTLRAIWEEAATLVRDHEGQTEEHWVRPVLRLLGYAFQVQTPILDAAGVTRWPDYALFDSDNARLRAQGEAATAGYFRTALGVADAKVWDAPLDRTRGGSLHDRRNPNYQIDAYLRETDQRWGILTNGRLWRLYCRDTSYRLDSYYEVDLVALLDGDAEPFKYFWHVFRAGALARQPDAFVDRILSGSQDYAEALSARVKGSVYEALRVFINGFLSYPRNGLNAQTDLTASYESALILLYRLLFALYGEAHGLLPVAEPSYRETYSLARIKEDLAARLDDGVPLLRTTNNYYADLKSLFAIIDEGAPDLGVPEYNGGLFDPVKHPFLAEHEIGDAYLAEGLDLLARVEGADGKVFVDYRTLEVRHLGDIYEGLLEYHPRYAEVEMVAVREGQAERWKPAAERTPSDLVTATVEAGECFLATGKGERRATGSYYTPQDVVRDMVSDSVGRLVSAIEDSHTGAERVEALLGLRVCDVALGSGHFLVEVVDHIARAVVRAGGVEDLADTETDLQGAKRRVVERCVYGVDVNPLAVELAKLSLWLATVARDQPLSFLDAHLACGNSLTGSSVDELASLSANPTGQVNFVEDRLSQVVPQLLDRTNAIVSLASTTAQNVIVKEQLLEELNELRTAFVAIANLWTAKRFGLNVTEDLYFQAVASLSDPEGWSRVSQGAVMTEAQQVAAERAFFHWELAFPDVFLNPQRPRGFDVVITNPPYVSAAERTRSYGDEDNAFWRWRYESATGAFDLYIPYIELALRLTREGGLASLITPNKYLAAPYGKALRGWIEGRHELVHLVDASRVALFEDPRVYPVISVFRAHTTSGDAIRVTRLGDGSEDWVAYHPADALRKLPEAIWAFLLLEDAELLLRISSEAEELEGYLGLRAVASTSAAEADRFGPEIREEHLSPAPGWRMVTTGTLGSYGSAWGLGRLQHQGRAFLRPVLPFKSSEVTSNRRDQYWAPKLIFRKLSLALEAAVDAEGDYASMNTNFVIAGQIDPYALGALMNSRVLRWIYDGFFGALRMGGGYLQVQAPQLRVLPMPRLSGSLTPEELESAHLLVNDERVSEVTGEPEARCRELSAVLAVLGREICALTEETRGLKIELVRVLLDAVGRTMLRERDPAFILPRQSAILEAVADPNATDLTTFWRAMRPTVRTLGASLTPAIEAALLRAVQLARPRLVELRRESEATRARIDEVVFALYGLGEADVQRILAGHDPPPGIVVDVAL